MCDIAHTPRQALHSLIAHVDPMMTMLARQDSGNSASAARSETRSTIVSCVTVSIRSTAYA